MRRLEESSVKHTRAGEMPDTAPLSAAGRRFEADLPLLSDPVVIRNLSIFFGTLILGLGAGFYFYRKKRSA